MKNILSEKDEIIKILINFVTIGKSWNRKEIIIDDIFAYTIALEIMEADEDHEPRSIDECW